MDNFPFIFFNCTFLTGMCICIKNGPSVLHKYLETYYDVRFEFVVNDKMYFYNCVSYATELCVIPNFPQKSFRSPAFILYETIK